jgi:hypothetical protein
LFHGERLRDEMALATDVSVGEEGVDSHTFRCPKRLGTLASKLLRIRAIPESMYL